MRTLNLVAPAAALVFSLALPHSAEAGRGGSQLDLPADFELTYCPNATTVDPSCAWMESVLDTGGVWEHIALHIPGLGTLPYTLWGDWTLRRGGRKLIIELDDAFDTTYVGWKVSDNCWAGQYTADTNPPTGGAWEGCVVE